MAKDRFAAQFQRERLHRAAEDGDLAGVEKWLAAKYPVNRFDFLDKTPLHYAVRGNHFDVIDRLLRAGARINARLAQRAGNTPLRDSIREMSFEMAKYLVKAGADPDIPGWMGITAIHAAEMRKDANRRKILQLLHAASPRRKGTRQTAARNPRTRLGP